MEERVFERFVRRFENRLPLRDTLPSSPSAPGSSISICCISRRRASVEPLGEFSAEGRKSKLDLSDSAVGIWYPLGLLPSSPCLSASWLTSFGPKNDCDEEGREASWDSSYVGMGRESCRLYLWGFSSPMKDGLEGYIRICMVFSNASSSIDRA